MVPLLVYLWVVLRRWLALLWLRFNRFLVQPSRLETATRVRHKLLVLGDGYAEGLGDWVQMGSNAGIVRRLQTLAGKDERLRQYWRFVALGRTGSVSGDWLNVMSGDEKDTGLLRRFLTKKSYADARIAVLMLGAMDVLFRCDQLPLPAQKRVDTAYVFPDDELAVLVKNLVGICEYLRSLGMHVILCDIPQELPGMRKFRGRIKKLNRQIRQYVERRRAEDVDKKTRPQLRLVKTGDGALARPQSLAFDGQHFNAAGYKILGERVFEEALPLMVGTELTGWKEMMMEQKNAAG